MATTNTNTRTTTTANRSSASSSNARVTQKARPGLISHTEFASRDPKATRDFCAKLFGWEFEVEQGPTGDYHMFRFEEGSGAENTGGGIRALLKAEAPAAIPYVEVEDIAESERVAKQNGAKILQPRTEMGGNGSLLILQAPGGPILGLWAPNV